MYNLVDKNQYKQLCQKLKQSHRGDGYIDHHERRHYELFDHLAHFTQGIERPRVAEIGLSAFTRLYKPLFPHIELVTVDRPVTMNGADETYGLEECGAAAHYNANLNEEALHPNWGNPPIGRFDFVVFCEVLEHLPLDATQLIGELISLLKPNGRLFLTTPNFFSLHHLQQIARRENPQDSFPRRGEDADASCHFREYTLEELVEATEQAQGKVVKAYYSDVWHGESQNGVLQEQPQLRSNLLLVAAPQTAVLHDNSEIRHDRTLAQSTPSGQATTVEAETLRNEVLYLRSVVEAYEQGRFMRFMRWLNKMGIGG